MAKITKKKAFTEKLTKKLNNSGVAPFLFIGSGVSRRYVNAPTWDSLLEQFVTEFSDCFKYEYGYYSSLANKDLAVVASNLSAEFHEFWWREDRFKISREYYKSIAAMDKEKPFKIELCNLLKDKICQRDELKDEINLFTNAVISGILTTNWDNFLENKFKAFTPRIGQKEIIFNDQKSIGEIFKIHGCITRPETLVVTKDDYDLFINKSHYLNSKILTLLVDFPIIFMGYSLSDKNIEKIISNLVDCLRQELIEEDKLKDRLFFIDWQSEPCEPTLITTTYSLNSISIPINKIVLHEYTDILNVLINLKRTFSIEILKRLESMVYDFVMTSEPTNKILVTGIENLNKIDDLEVVVGFGNIDKLQQKGVLGVEIGDLLEDIIYDTIPHENYKDIVEKLLPSKINKSSFFPFFKFNKFCENLNSDNSLKSVINKNIVLSNSSKITLEDYKAKTQKSYSEKYVSKYVSLEDLINQNPNVTALKHIPYFKLLKTDVDVLRDYLKTIWTLNLDQKSTDFSAFRKCVCILDFLENAY
jgi:hypothetical protein